MNTAIENKLIQSIEYKEDLYSFVKTFFGESCLMSPFNKTEGAVFSIKESSGPQNQWVHIALKASKSAGANAFPGR